MLAATHFLGEFAAGTTRQELNQAVDEGYQHLDYAQRLTLANEYYHFLTTMRPGDLVATVADDELYVGEIAGDAEMTEDKDARLQRPVNWAAGAASAVAELTAPLSTEIDQQGTVVDLTSAAEMLAELFSTGDAAVAAEPTEPPELSAVTSDLAEQLHLEQQWLQEMVNLLQDRQQIVLYGPPGTGKTYLARKLARHLTGADAASVDRPVTQVERGPVAAADDVLPSTSPVPLREQPRCERRSWTARMRSPVRSSSTGVSSTTTRVRRPCSSRDASVAALQSSGPGSKTV